MKRLTYILSALLLMGVMYGLQTPRAQATTTIDKKVITKDVTWTAKESPYKINGYAEVQSQATLTIEPGVKVLLHEDASVGTFEGTLEVEGSEKLPVVFEAIDNQGSVGVSFGNATIRHANFLSDVELNAFRGDISLTHTIHEGGSGNGIEIGNSDVSMQDVTVENYDQAGVWLRDDGSEVSIIRSTIEGNSVGVELREPILIPMSTNTQLSQPSVSVSESVLKNNTKSAVSVENINLTVQATNNFWGDPSGPQHPDKNPSGVGNSVSDRVTFDPWLEKNPLAEPEGAPHSSVAFIPGFQGSRLYRVGVGVNDTDRLWEPEFITDTSQLFFNESGESKYDVRVDGIIDEIRLPQIPDGFGVLGTVYADFEDSLDELVANGQIESWQAFPYDWRKRQDKATLEDVTLLDGSTYNMVDRLEALAEESGIGKVSIVGHSNGGLVGKLLLSELKRQGKSNLVDKLIMVGTPQLGTPKSIGALLHGEGQSRGFVGIPVAARKRDAIQLAKTLPGAYGLLPSEKYFGEVSEAPVTFEDGEATQAFRNAYGESIDAHTELTNFVLGNEGRDDPEGVRQPAKLSPSTLDSTQEVQDVLDDWQAPSSTEVTQLVGWGQDTIKGINYYERSFLECGGNWITEYLSCATLSRLDYEPVITQEGDGTVVRESAGGMNNVERYLLDMGAYNTRNETSYEHFNFTEFPIAQEVVQDVLINKDVIVGEFIRKTNVEVPNAEEKYRLSVHSPVEISVTNAKGQKVTVQKDDESQLSYPIEEIPNSTYLEFGEGKYIFVPASGVYDVNLNGTGTGTFTFEATKLSGTGDVVASTTFKHVPVSTSTEASVDLDKNNLASSTLSLDYDGDGQEDKEFATGLGIVTISHVRNAVANAKIHHGIKRAINAKIDSIERAIEKDKLKQVRKKTQKLIEFVNKHASKKGKGEKKKGKSKSEEPKQPKVNPEDGDTIVPLLEKFKDRFNE